MEELDLGEFELEELNLEDLNLENLNLEEKWAFMDDGYGILGWRLYEYGYFK